MQRQAVLRRSAFLCLIACLIVHLVTLSVSTPVRAGARQEVSAAASAGDAFRALIVFVRFRDDNHELTGCIQRDRQWHQPDQLPEIANYVLSEVATPPFDENSLTDYFYQQSNGHLTLFGSVFPDVVVTAGRETDYGAGGVNVGLLTPEILKIVDDDRRVDLSDFDADDDGYLDKIVFVIRRMRGPGFRAGRSTVRSGIAFTGYSSTQPEFGRSGSKKMFDASHSGVYVNYGNPGNIFPDLNLTRLMAHELLHTIWRPFHVEAIGGRTSVPASAPSSIGFQLMAGPGDRGGSLTLSAAERHMIDSRWINCVRLREDGSVRITDLYSANTSNCFFVDVRDTLGQAGSLYLSNRQRLSYFDTMRSEACGGGRSDHGLMTTGLLATKVDSEGRVSTIAADNSLELSIQAETYDGDMFGSLGAVQLTPWTRPNIHGMNGYPEGFVLDSRAFPAIDQIRSSGESGSEMTFNFVTDFRQQPVFRSDSQIGPESSGLEIFGPASIAEDREVRVNTEVTVRGSLVVERGGILAVEQNASLTVDTLILRRGSFAAVDGVVNVLSRLHNEGADIGIGASGRLDGGEGAHPPIGTQQDHEPVSEASIAVYPNPMRDHLMIRLGGARFTTVELYDIVGRRIEVKRIANAGMVQSTRLDTAHLAAGTYVVRVRSENLVETRAVVRLP